MKNSARSCIALAGVALLAFTAAGCSDEPLVPAPSSPVGAEPTAPAPATDPAAQPGEGSDPTGAAPGDGSGTTEEPAPTEEPVPEEELVPTVPGYPAGEFPAVPMFVLPDLAIFDDELSDDMTRELASELSGTMGVSVVPAHCDEDGELIAGNHSALLYANDEGDFTAPDGTTQSYGRGAGTLTVNGESAKGEADGFGSFSEGELSIRNYGDGTGTYSDSDVSVQLYGHGSGTFVSGDATIQNDGSGAGNFFGDGIKIQNNGDGSGSYSDATITIQNIGDGTGFVNAEPVAMDPLPPLPPLGVFPPLPALQPTESCGALIRIDTSLLFESDSAELRSGGLLGDIAAELDDQKVPRAIVSALSDEPATDVDEARQDALVEELRANVADARIAVGETGDVRPVAAAKIDGVDNAAGQQMNRRVEIYVPTVEDSPAVQK